jgi:hypothetical protein
MEEVCDEGCALAILKQKWPREWIAVCMRWHFVVVEDEVEETARDAWEKMAKARREENEREVKWKLRIYNTAQKRREQLERERMKWEITEQYGNGMARLGAMLDEKVAV